MELDCVLGKGDKSDSQRLFGQDRLCELIGPLELLKIDLFTTT